MRNFGTVARRAITAAIGLVALPSSAEASGYYCWGLEFVPGEHHDVEAQGQVQTAKYWYSGQFETSAGSLTGLGVIADSFKEYLQKSTTPLSGKSRYVTECKAAPSDYEKFEWRLQKPHDQWGNESNGRPKEKLDWVPSAALLEDLQGRERKELAARTVYMQCFGAKRTGGSSYAFEADAEVSRTAVFKIQLRDATSLEQQFRDYYPKQALDAQMFQNRCQVTNTLSAMKDWEVDEIDHYASAKVVQSDFKPDIDAKPITALQGPPPRHPALTISAPKDTPKGWTPEQISRAREAAAEQAKKLADAKRNDASAQAKIRKFFEDMKKRGSAQ